MLPIALRIYSEGLTESPWGHYRGDPMGENATFFYSDIVVRRN